MRFGERLKLELERRDIKQKDFAQKINVSASTLCGYINTNRQPDFDLVKLIAAELGVSIDYLLDYTLKDGAPPLSMKENEFLAKLRLLDEEEQEAVFMLCDLLSKKKQ